MRRRDVLGAAVAVASTGPTQLAWAQPQPSAARPVLLGSAEGLAGFDMVTGTWWHWPFARQPASPVAADARATWATDRDGRAWRRRHADGAPRPVDLPEPVHAWTASPDGDAVFAAHGSTITLLDADGRPRHRWACRDLAGRREGPAVALAWHAGRRSLIASLPAVGEAWIVSLDPDAPPIHDGLVHDYRMGEAIPTPGHLGVRRVPLAAPPPALWCDGVQPWVVAREADGTAGIVHLDVRRRIAGIGRAGLRPAHGTVTVGPDGGPRWWVPVDDGVAVMDARRWVVSQVIATPGPADLVAVVAGQPWVAGHDADRVWWAPLDERAPLRPVSLDGLRGTVVAMETAAPTEAPASAVTWVVVSGTAAAAVRIDRVANGPRDVRRAASAAAWAALR